MHVINYSGNKDGRTEVLLQAWYIKKLKRF